MAEIKSTLEKVMERAAAMGNANKDEIAAEERVRDGMRMGGDYLKGEEVDFSSAINSDVAKARYVNGILEVRLKKLDEKHTNIRID